MNEIQDLSLSQIARYPVHFVAFLIPFAPIPGIATLSTAFAPIPFQSLPRRQLLCFGLMFGLPGLFFSVVFDKECRLFFFLLKVTNAQRPARQISCCHSIATTVSLAEEAGEILRPFERADSGVMESAEF